MNPMILGGNLAWPIGQARDVIRHYRDITPTAPDVLQLEVGLFATPEGPIVNIEACWCGDHAQGEAWLAPLRAFGKPVFDDIAPMPYVRLQSSFDEPLAGGKYYYAKNGFLTGIDDSGIDILIDVFQREPGLFSLFLDPCDGAYHRVALDATAFPNRSAMYWLGLVAGWPDAEGSEARISRIRTAWVTLEPLTQGFYTNLSDPDTTLAGYRENYGANFERLVALKAKYDPMNLFRLNANVPPKI
jgi:hypothetical protein